MLFQKSIEDINLTQILKDKLVLFEIQRKLILKRHRSAGRESTVHNGKGQESPICDADSDGAVVHGNSDEEERKKNVVYVPTMLMTMTTMLKIIVIIALL